MSAYAQADARYQAELEAMRHNDLIMEQLTDELLDDPELLASALAELEESAKATQRLSIALHTLYHDYKLITPEVMQVRAALYGVVKQHCQSVLS